MRLSIVAVGKLRPGPASELAGVYARRLAPHCRLEVIEVPHAGGGPDGQRLAQEAKRLERHLDRAGHVVALDRGGREVDSLGLARCVDRWRRAGKAVLLLVGGPLGLEESVKKKLGFEVREYRIEYYGMCADCRARSKNGR